MEDVVIITDASGHVQSLNPAAKRLTCLILEAALGTPLHRVLQTTNKLLELPTEEHLFQRLSMEPVIDLGDDNHLINRGLGPDFVARTIAVNLSGVSLSQEGFLEFVCQQISEYGIPSKILCFEITETSAIANLDNALVFMNELKQRGRRFALDDFGRGLSSLFEFDREFAFVHL